jgi:hypothetical protein
VQIPGLVFALCLVFHHFESAHGKHPASVKALAEGREKRAEKKKRETYGRNKKRGASVLQSTNTPLNQPQGIIGFPAPREK